MSAWGLESGSSGPALALLRYLLARSDLVQNAASSVLRRVIKPVVIDDHNQIVAGHVVWRAAKTLGLKRIPIIRVSHLSETELRAYALADNQLATKSAWDLEILSLELGELELALPEIGLDLTITGFEPAEIDAVFDNLEADVANPADDAPELNSLSPIRSLIRLGNHDRAAASEMMRHLLVASSDAAFSFVMPPHCENWAQASPTLPQSTKNAHH